MDYRNDASNGLGKRFFNCIVSLLPWRFASVISASPQNSHRICRQAPQGGVRTSVSAATAMRLNLRAPSEIALNTATRSAQIVSPYVAFSMLQPVKMRPFSSSSAAPTLNFENGACACSRAANAASISLLIDTAATLSKIAPACLEFDAPFPGLPGG